MKKLLVGVVLAAMAMAIGCGGSDPPPPVKVAPTADFDWAPANPDIDQNTDFTDTSDPGTADGVPATITDWSWTFTGGNPATSDVEDPTNVTFATSGFKSVTLTVTADTGLSSTLTKQVPIKDPDDVTAPTLDVESVVIKGTATDNVAVTTLTDDIAGGTIATDGTADEASEPFETHVVTMGSGPGANTQTVTITADDTEGTGPTDVTVTIDESDPVIVIP